MMNYRAKVPALPHREVCCVYSAKEHHLNVIDEYIDDAGREQILTDRVFKE